MPVNKTLKFLRAIVWIFVGVALHVQIVHFHEASRPMVDAVGRNVATSWGHSVIQPLVLHALPTSATAPAPAPSSLI